MASAAVAAAAGTGVVLAGESDPGPGQTPEPGEVRNVRAERVAAPPTVASTGVARAAAQRKAPARRPALAYLETEPQAIAPGPTGFRVGNCPKRSKAINGYYYVAGTQVGFGVDNQGDSPVRGLRQWAFYLEGPQPAGATNVVFGLVCLKNVG
jgi:hypothetical protein